MSDVKLWGTHLAGAELLETQDLNAANKVALAPNEQKDAVIVGAEGSNIVIVPQDLNETKPVVATQDANEVELMASVAKAVVSHADMSAMLKAVTSGKDGYLDVVDVTSAFAIASQSKNTDEAYAFLNATIVASLHKEICENSRLEQKEQEALYKALTDLVRTTDLQTFNDVLNVANEFINKATFKQDNKSIEDKLSLLCHGKKLALENLDRLDRAVATAPNSQAVANDVRAFNKQFLEALTLGNNLAFGFSSLKERVDKLQVGIKEISITIDNDTHAKVLVDKYTAEITDGKTTFEKAMAASGGIEKVAQGLHNFAKEHVKTFENELATILETSAKTLSQDYSYENLAGILGQIDKLFVQCEDKCGKAIANDFKEQSEDKLSMLQDLILQEACALSPEIKTLHDEKSDLCLKLLQGCGFDKDKLAIILRHFDGDAKAFVQCYEAMASELNLQGLEEADKQSAIAKKGEQVRVFLDTLLSKATSLDHVAYEEIRLNREDPTSHPLTLDQKDAHLTTLAENIKLKDAITTLTSSLATDAPTNSHLIKLDAYASALMALGTFIPVLITNGQLPAGTTLKDLELTKLIEIANNYFNKTKLAGQDFSFLKECDLFFLDNVAKLYNMQTGKSLQDFLQNEIKLDAKTAALLSSHDLESFPSLAQLNGYIKHIEKSKGEGKDFANFVLNYIEPGQQELRASIKLALAKLSGLSVPNVDQSVGDAQLIQNIVRQKLPFLQDSLADGDALVAIEERFLEQKSQLVEQKSVQDLMLSTRKLKDRQTLEAILAKPQSPERTNELIIAFDRTHLQKGETEASTALLIHALSIKDVHDLTDSQLSELDISRSDLNPLNTALLQDTLMIHSDKAGNTNYKALAYTLIKERMDLDKLSFEDAAKSVLPINMTQDGNHYVAQLKARFELSSEDKLQTLRGFSELNFTAFEKKERQANANITSEQLLAKFFATQDFSLAKLSSHEAVLMLKERKEKFQTPGAAIDRIMEKVVDKKFVNLTGIKALRSEFSSTYASRIAVSDQEKMHEVVSKEAIAKSFDYTDEQIANVRSLIGLVLDEVSLQENLQSREDLMLALAAEGGFRRNALDLEGKRTTTVLNAIKDAGVDEHRAIILMRDYLALPKNHTQSRNMRVAYMQALNDYFGKKLRGNDAKQLQKQLLANQVADTLERSLLGLSEGEKLNFIRKRGISIEDKFNIEIKANFQHEGLFSIGREAGKFVISCDKSFMQEYAVGLGYDVPSASFGVSVKLGATTSSTFDFTFNTEAEAATFFGKLLTGTFVPSDVKTFSETTQSSGINVFAGLEASLGLSTPNSKFNLQVDGALTGQLQHKVSKSADGIVHSFATVTSIEGKLSARIGEEVQLYDKDSGLRGKLDSKLERLSTKITKDGEALRSDDMVATAQGEELTFDSGDHFGVYFNTKGIEGKVERSLTIQNELQFVTAINSDRLEHVYLERTLEDISEASFQRFCNHLNLSEAQISTLRRNARDLNEHGVISKLTLRTELDPKLVVGNDYQFLNSLLFARTHADDFKVTGFTFTASDARLTTTQGKERDVKILHITNLKQVGNEITLEGSL